MTKKMLYCIQTGETEGCETDKKRWCDLCKLPRKDCLVKQSFEKIYLECKTCDKPTCDFRRLNYGGAKK